MAGGFIHTLWYVPFIIWTMPYAMASMIIGGIIGSVIFITSNNKGTNANYDGLSYPIIGASVGLILCLSGSILLTNLPH